MLSSFSRPTAVAVRRALSLFSPVSPLPQNQQNFTISALTKREFLLLFSKSNAFSFLSETKRRRSCGGQGEPSWSTRPIHPVRLPKQTPDRRNGQKKSRPNFDQKSVGSCPTFFDKKWSSTAHRSAPSLPPHIFSNRKKICFAVSRTQKLQKGVQKSFHKLDKSDRMWCNITIAES